MNDNEFKKSLKRKNRFNYVSRLELGMGIDPLSSSDNCHDSMDEMKHIESDIWNQINIQQQTSLNDLLCDDNSSRSVSLDSTSMDNDKTLNNDNDKRIYLNSNTIYPNTTSQLFEIKLLLNFDVVRNRWIILKEQYEFLLRLKLIESLQVIHFVMVHQSVLNKQSSQYYSISKIRINRNKINKIRNKHNNHNNNNNYNDERKKMMTEIDENDVIEIDDKDREECKGII